MSEPERFDPWPIGLLGCGTSLALYEGIEQHNKHFKLIAVADSDLSRAQLAAKRFGVNKSYESAKKMYERENLRLVLIVTPPENHLPSILEAADAGLHILVQKPLARTLSEAKQITEACHKKNLGLKVSFYKRYTPVFQAAHRMTERLGQALALRIKWCSSSGLKARKDKLWKEKIDSLGGVLVDLGSHVVDIARWWMGEVTAGHLAMSIVKGELDNISSFLLRHGSGSTLGYLSNMEYSSSEVYEYVAELGGFKLKRQTEGYPGSWSLSSWESGVPAPQQAYFDPPNINPFLAELIDFIESSKRGEISVDAGELGRAALQTTTMLYRSAGQQPDQDLEDFRLEEFFRASKRV